MMRVWRLSVAYVRPKSRTERPRKTEIAAEVAHMTWTPLSRSKVNLRAGAYCGGLPHSLLCYPDELFEFPRMNRRWGKIRLDQNEKLFHTRIMCIMWCIDDSRKCVIMYYLCTTYHGQRAALSNVTFSYQWLSTLVFLSVDCWKNFLIECLCGSV